MPGNLEGILFVSIIHSAGALQGPCETQGGQRCPADWPLARISERDGLNVGLVGARPGNSTGDRDRKAKSKSLFYIFSYGLVCLKKRKEKVGWLTLKGSCR